MLLPVVGRVDGLAPAAGVDGPEVADLQQARGLGRQHHGGLSDVALEAGLLVVSEGRCGFRFSVVMRSKNHP
ncbi:hypothetical protein QJS10_CPA08g01759 [Acorus calamus]|uniref:Uncharacterized protein n=1 Tax=Acorus calamus TaxID=4465 RepID=A0AAV9EDB9_ACOCL|nr:hypothetical protein QJS10_CPA08g01759 [Acorus calamus]